MSWRFYVAMNLVAFVIWTSLLVGMGEINAAIGIACGALSLWGSAYFCGREAAK